MFAIRQAINLKHIHKVYKCQPVLLLPNLNKNNFLSLEVKHLCSTSNIEGQNSAEEQLQKLLHKRFPAATAVEVQDISGGCGAMYEVWVEAPDFKGLSRVKQHRLITETLAAEIKDMHGLRISTSVSAD